MTNLPERQFDHLKGQVALIVSEFNRDISEGLLSSAEKALDMVDGVDFEVFWVPGAFEIPLSAKMLAESGKYDVIMALGAVIKGETYHFELVANECARGCMQVMLETNVPLVFEVLAAYSYDDALRRSKGIHSQGRTAAYVALEWLERLNTFSSQNDG